MFYVQRLTNGTLSLAFWTVQHRGETVPDLCLIALVFSRQLEAFSTQHLRGLNRLETFFFFFLPQTKVAFFKKKN